MHQGVPNTSMHGQPLLNLELPVHGRKQVIRHLQCDVKTGQSYKRNGKLQADISYEYRYKTLKNTSTPNPAIYKKNYTS